MVDLRDHRHFVECGSTNDIAREWIGDAVEPAAEWSVVTADFQTSGRGRRGREWWSQPGDNALMSVVVRPAYSVGDAWKLAFVAALAVSDVVVELGASPALKWPNDILIDGRKVSGILIETVIGMGSDWAAIVGIGVNVNQASFDDEYLYEVRPVSLQMALGRTVDVDVDVVRKLCLEKLIEREGQHRREGFAAIVAAWQERMASGYEIKRGASRGIQSQLLDTGEIEVRLPDGTLARWGTVDA